MLGRLSYQGNQRRGGDDPRRRGDNPTRTCAISRPCPASTKVVPISKPYKLVSRELHPEPSVIQVGNVAIGGDRLVVIAGPCAVEERERTLEIARSVRHVRGRPVPGRRLQAQNIAICLSGPGGGRAQDPGRGHGQKPGWGLSRK